MSRASRTSRGYDVLARCYRPLEFCLFGSALQRSRVALVGQVPQVERAMVLGDGDGRLLEQMCVRLPGCHFTSVDSSGVMLRLQRDRLARAAMADRVDWVQQNAADFVAERGSYDLMVVAFFLDCFSPPELSRTLPSWLALLRPGGLLYFVDFVHPQTRFRRMQSALYQMLMHALFRVVTGLPNRKLVDFDEILDVPELRLVADAGEIHPMTACRIYEFLPTWDADRRSSSD